MSNVIPVRKENIFTFPLCFIILNTYRTIVMLAMLNQFYNSLFRNTCLWTESNFHNNILVIECAATQAWKISLKQLCETYKYTLRKVIASEYTVISSHGNLIWIYIQRDIKSWMFSYTKMNIFKSQKVWFNILFWFLTFPAIARIETL